MNCEKANYVIAPEEITTSLGIVFHEDRWYRWCNALGAYALCDQEEAIHAVKVIVEALAEVPFDPALSTAFNVGRDGRAAQRTH